MECTKLGIIGSAGRMGHAIVEHFQGIPDIEVTATLEAGEPLEQFLASACKIAVDVSVGEAVDKNGPKIVQAGIGYIVGATGYGRATLDALAQASQGNGAPVLVVPNFSLGANLMIKFATEAARLMRSPVITERHHEHKADAPSGTALYTAGKLREAQLEAKAALLPSTAAQYREQLVSVLGGEAGGIAIHSVRGEGYLAEQAVQFTLPGELLTIEHRSIDRRCFMPGIEYAIRNLHRVRGLQIGLDSIM